MDGYSRKSEGGIACLFLEYTAKPVSCVFMATRGTFSPFFKNKNGFPAKTLFLLVPL